ncbi:MAG TPA: hypothetical protein VGG57_08495 [Stellaceae bacterium]|jgi:hypothetical protein
MCSTTPTGNGALVLGTIAHDQATYVAVGNVGAEWNFHTTNPALIGAGL